jgi:hypothetical protein
MGVGAIPATKAMPDIVRQSGQERWLVFVHQLPAHPSNARVKTWRRLQQLGAVSVKNAVHVLPNTAQAVEDFEWLRTEVVALGGQATIFTASSLSGLEEKHIVRQFKKVQTEEYAKLTKDIRALRTSLHKGYRFDDDARRKIDLLRERLSSVQQKDFFGASGGRQAQAALKHLAGKLHKPTSRATADATSEKLLDRRDYVRRTWVTRPHPGVDRFASAWFIRRFIDPYAAFVFAESPTKHPAAVPFDMYQSGGFKHEGDRCTFEVLQHRFPVDDAAIRSIAEIVHDLDLKDDRYKNPHRATIGVLVEGLRAAVVEDGALLEHGIVMFEALYQSCRPPKGRTTVKGIC